MWPSGLRRVTRNHFSYGGVGSNPAIVVSFYTNILNKKYNKKGEKKEEKKRKPQEKKG